MTRITYPHILLRLQWCEPLLALPADTQLTIIHAIATLPSTYIRPTNVSCLNARQSLLAILQHDETIRASKKSHRTISTFPYTFTSASPTLPPVTTSSNLHYPASFYFVATTSSPNTSVTPTHFTTPVVQTFNSSQHSFLTSILFDSKRRYSSQYDVKPFSPSDEKLHYPEP